MKQYIGIIVMLIGALLQLFTYFTDQVENANLFLGTGLPRHGAYTRRPRLSRSHLHQQEGVTTGPKKYITPIASCPAEAGQLALF